MQDIATQVLSVQGSTTKNGRAKYEIALADGTTYVTFKPELAAKAQSLMGQDVAARVNVSQNGRYTNYYLEDIASQGSLPPLAMPVPAGAPVPVNAPPLPPVPVAPAAPSNGGMSPERETKIVKQSMLAAAANLVGHLFEGAGPEATEQAVELVGQIARGWFAEVMGVGPTVAPQVAPQVADAVTPAAIAAAIPGVQVGVGAVETPPSQSAIPWSN